jgi:peptidoglycan/xylan/chitin deacetylase (PgdA/CDA1 family)
MLQVALPSALRSEIIDQLFRRHVSTDEDAFAEELYVTADQLSVMVSAGMHVGSHGDRHFWLGQMPKADQEGMIPKYRTLSYPYGDYNEDTIRILTAKGFKAAVTTEVAIAHPIPDQRFTLPRLDTNHLPKDQHAAPSEWTRRAL